ncbi:MAG: GPR endopeptidase [Bacilli bacterium]
MKHEIDLKNYQIRTDLIVEQVKDENNVSTKVYDENGIKITTVEVDKNMSEQINKKVGDYVTIEFDDVTDSHNQEIVKKIFSEQLSEIIKKTKIKDSDKCLIIGLGNDKSTPDSLGPLTIDKVLVTNHLFMYGQVEEGFRSVSAIIPGVTGTTGIETSDLIKSVVDGIKPDFLIMIDALASQALDRVNKTIQISNTGIHPGSGVGNSRKEISKDTTGIPVIAIGIPTVVDAVTVVSDTINYMQKHYAFHKKFIKNPLSKLVSSTQINYLKKEVDIEKEDKINLLGIVGSLNEMEIKQLILEVLTPIGYNLMVTPKEVDFIVEKLATILGEGINISLHEKIKKEN